MADQKSFYTHISIGLTSSNVSSISVSIERHFFKDLMRKNCIILTNYFESRKLETVSNKYLVSYVNSFTLEQCEQIACCKGEKGKRFFDIL